MRNLFNDDFEEDVQQAKGKSFMFSLYEKLTQKKEEKTVAVSAKEAETEMPPAPMEEPLSSPAADEEANTPKNIHQEDPTLDEAEEGLVCDVDGEALECQPLALYWRAWKKEQEKSGELPEELISLLAGKGLPEELAAFVKAMQDEAMIRICDLSQNPQKQLPAVVRVRASQDGLTAWCFVLPPRNGGKEVLPRDVDDALKQAGVVYGLVEGIGAQISQAPLYMQLVVAANGVPAEDGIDGEIINVIPTTAGSSYIDVEQKVVDYKNLNWLVPVEEGEIICKVINPVEAVDGMSVFGSPIAGARAVKPKIPMGRNTMMSEDGCALVAAIQGQVSFQNGKYRVDQAITVEGNVDLSTGNLKVTGNLRVKGNVCDSFCVQATGDITIDGVVEGAEVKAGGSILVRRGMNGNSKGTLQAGKDVRCSYLENGVVIAGGDISMQSIINSKVTCGGNIVVNTGRGVIIGGSVSALEMISVKIVGNSSTNRPTSLSVGRTPEYIAKRAELMGEVNDTMKKLGILQDEIDFCLKVDPEGNAQRIGEFRLKSSVLQLKLANFQKELDKIVEKDKRAEVCRIEVGVLNPVVQIFVDGLTKNVYDTYNHCKIYKRDGEITFGTK